MARTGKIARLPQEIREELNQRLEDNEHGGRLVDWLNSLPGVKEVLATEFQGREISDANLSDWRQGGFREWKAQRKIEHNLNDLKADCKGLAQSPAVVLDDMETAVLACYASAVQDSKLELTKELQAQLQCLSRTLRDVVRYRRSQQTRERTQIQRDSLEIKRQKTEEGQRKKFLELANDPKLLEKITPKMTWEEKAKAVEAFLAREKR